MSVAAAEIWKRAREAWRGWGPDLSFDLFGCFKHRPLTTDFGATDRPDDLGDPSVDATSGSVDSWEYSKD
ncbi:hypothetical protein RRG08_055756 [Elysia crispata]|uniref:Uncharacterized protein n=1 Tax=Elysia crispata TaxID=231223 RepID=A0AAE1ACN2_9GAST|nr:hypothetical protein RRG08_055756 [Elysia crispata]